MQDITLISGLKYLVQMLFICFGFKNVLNKELGLKYKNCVLSCGGSENMDKLFFDFAQREPKIDSLLKIDGII